MEKDHQNIGETEGTEMGRITTGEQYIESLRGRNLKLYFMGELVDEPVDHPVIRPSINALAATYVLALQNPELGTAHSPLINKKINRFLHIAESPEDLVMQNKMQRRLGQITGTCFQRCVGMDALNALYSVTYEMDQKHGTKYHDRLLQFIGDVQERNLIIGGAMTDVKGDRSKAPEEQDDPDLYVHIVDRDEKGLYITGAKAHQTGCINSHWMIVMPTLRLTPEGKDYAVSGAIPVDAPGITYFYGRQSCDMRSMDTETSDVGNQMFAGQEALVIFDRVFIPWELVFMDGEYDFAAMLVERFTVYHRRSYVCKSGVGDVLIGAAATIAEYNGVDRASHIRDKLVEMTHLNETIYSTGIASSYQAYPTKSGAFLNDDMLANVCKHHVTKTPYEIGRIAQDLAGGIVVTLPSGKDFINPETGELLKKYFKGRADLDTEDRIKIIRLIENMTLGRNAVGYLTESLHGAGSPQAQRIHIARSMQLPYKKALAKRLAGIEGDTPPPDGGNTYMERVFKPEKMD
jgi:4-hydroxybutyryl-CoA dehydratase/vinylacetyl-CoA-Delta-isomerase